MKRFRKPILLTFLTLALCFGPATPARAEGGRIWIDGYLVPDVPRPRGGASYEAELWVDTQTGKKILKGTCTTEGEITDQERALAVREALDSVPEYDDISDAAEDQKDVEDLTKELKANLENPGPILENFIKCSGYDKVVDILRLKVPGYSWDDIVKMFMDMLKNKPVKDIVNPMPLTLKDAVSGAIIGTVKVSWEEYKNDQERWQDITDLANAKERLRIFDGVVKDNLRKYAEKRMAWTIRIQDEYTEDLLYDQMLKAEAPMIHSTDIVLKKSGDISSPYGTYTGKVLYKGEVNLKEYDKALPAYYAKFWDRSGGDTDMLGHYAGVGVTITRPSENKLVLEQNEFSFDMKKENGYAGVYDASIDPGKMELKEYHVLHDYAVTVERKEPSGSRTITQTVIMDSETGTNYKSWFTHYVTSTGEVHDTSEEDSGEFGNTDPRGLLKLTLVISMY